MDTPGARIAARRSMRLVGRVMEDATLDASSIPEGPELVGTVTDIPDRTARAEPIRQKMLDVAEILFARWGYTGVSVRDVTDLAETRLANVTYYFGSKQNLYFEVLKRRARVLADARLAALRDCDALEAHGDRYVGRWVDSYVDPPVALLASGDAGWDHYLRLIGHVAYSRLWPNAFSGYYNGAAVVFMASLRREFPHAAEAIIQHCFLMLTATSMYTLARTGRVETFDEPAFSSDDMSVLAPLTKQFVAAGIVALLAGGA